MVAVISGTNRPGSQTSVVARFCMQWLAEHGIPAGLVELTSMNDLSVTPKQFNSDHQDEVIKQMRDEILIPANHWIVVSPEYNGSFPGILKWWIDLLSVKNRNTVFKNKKASLIGVASGRAGNLRGMDHLTGVLHYLGMLVMPEKLPISKIEDVISGDGQVTPGLAFALEKYLLDAFLEK